MTSTLPATDAISLSTSPRRRTSTRSPSPATLNTRFSPSRPGVQNITRKVMRRLSHLQGAHNDTDVDVLDEREEDSDSTIGSPTKEVRKKTDKIDWEIPRKVLHSSIGFFTVYLYLSQGSPKTVVYVLWTALAVIAPADFLRLRYPSFERVYERFLGFLMRESEKNSMNGVIWYILGVNFVLSVYPLDVATVAILILSWADTAASTFGRMFGSRTPSLPSRMPILHLPLAPRKSLAGFIAASITGTLIAITFWSLVAPSRTTPSDISWSWAQGAVGTSLTGWAKRAVEASGVVVPSVSTGGWAGLGVVGIVAGVVSGVAEALDLGSLDDNFTLPIISGGCILGFFKLLGLFSPSSA